MVLGSIVIGSGSETPDLVLGDEKTVGSYVNLVLGDCDWWRE